nr:hypothetical protein HAGR004_38250 [Bdellovibrio sp. HAGR004]
MKKLIFGSLILSSTLFAGCNKNSDTPINTAEVCRKEATDASNEVNRLATTISVSLTRAQIENVNIACNNYQELIKSQSCKTSVADLIASLKNTPSNEKFCTDVKAMVADFKKVNSEQSTSYKRILCGQDVLRYYAEADYRTRELSYRTSPHQDVGMALAFCNDFKSKMGNSACVAPDAFPRYLDSTSLASACDRTQKFFASSLKIMSDEEGNPKIAQLHSKIKMTLLVDDSVLMDSTLEFQDGKLFNANKKAADDLSSSCHFTLNKTKLVNGSVLEFDKFKDYGWNVVLSNQTTGGDYPEISCSNSRWSDGANIKIDDLKNAFMGIFKIEIVK